MAKDVRVKQRGPAYPNFPELLAHPHQSGGREGRAVPELTGDYCTVQSRLDVRWLHRQHGPAGPNAARERRHTARFEVRRYKPRGCHWV